ncbi:VanZ family protein [Fictibacillus sp. Mic-4]|uniref:VanZ family protein n=1 Tax=Fictibacillus TaxID=1329200 RepID=UPI0009D759D7|nr:VanZ family protein [Fictibacillus gelatini]
MGAGNTSYNGKKVRLQWRNYSFFVFFIYFSILIYTTLFTFNHYVYGKSFNLVLFDSIRLMWRSGSYWLIFKNIIGNILLFFPLGFLLPLISRWFANWQVMIVIGFGTSSIIEILQYKYFERIFDIDDILLNGLGTLVGLMLFKVCRFIYRVVERNLFKYKRK